MHRSETYPPFFHARPEVCFFATSRPHTSHMNPEPCVPYVLQPDTDSCDGIRSDPTSPDPLSPDDIEAIGLIVEYLCGRMRHLREECNSMDAIIHQRGRPSTRLSCYHFPVYLWECRAKQSRRIDAVIDQGSRRFSFHFRRAR